MDEKIITRGVHDQFMSGIVFFKSGDLESVRKFYVEDIGMDLWMEQEDCIILKHGNMLLGFCSRENVDTEGMITFYFETDREVDAFHGLFREISDGPPRINPKYNIYHFFCRDPEGRSVEFQRFLSGSANPC